MAFATFLVWRLRTGACGVGACGFWRYRMPPAFTKPGLLFLLCLVSVCFLFTGLFYESAVGERNVKRNVKLKRGSLGKIPINALLLLCLEFVFPGVDAQKMGAM